MAAACLAMCRGAAPCKDWRISSGAVKPRWRIWLRAFTLVDRAERLATISARMASTWPSRCLGLPELAVPLGGMGGLDGVHGIGLAFAATLLAVGAVHLHHLHPRPAQVTGQAGPVAAGALHPDPHHRAEAGQPTQQLAVTRRRGRKLLHPHSPPIRSNAAATFTSRWVSTPPVTGRAVSTVVTAIPSFISWFGVAGRPRAAGVIVLLAQDDPPRSVSEATTQLSSTNLFVKEGPPSGRLLQSDHTQANRPYPPPNNRWWIPISHSYILPAGLVTLMNDLLPAPACCWQQRRYPHIW